jgi:hypothetical protein
MIILKQKAASILTDAAYKGIKNLNPESACAKALKGIDVEVVLRADIARLCETASLTEITRISSLAAQLPIASDEKKAAIKRELKKIAETVTARAESTSGKLKIPSACRHLLLSL